MRTKLLLLFTLFTIATTVTTFAQTVVEAKDLAEAGQFEKARALYNEILQKDPENLAAIIGRAYNYSWAKKYSEAREQFELALTIDPSNADALVGNGYNLAWSKQYTAAKSSFQKLGNLNPGSIEARKGLAYVSLWEGNSVAAMKYFEELILEDSKQIEYYIALAQAYLLDHQIRKARIALRSALLIEPDNRIAEDLLQRTYGLAAPVELDIWSGYSGIGDMGKFSLRMVQLTAQVSNNLWMYLKYDNSLSMDLASLVRTNQDAQAFSIGAVTPIGKRYVSRVEYGARFLPENVVQHIFSTEQVYFPSDKFSLKLGGFLGISDSLNTEYLVYGSVRVPLSSTYAIEPYYFFSRVEGAPRAENRFMLNNQFRNKKGYELNLGAILGMSGLPAEVEDKMLYGGYITAVLPFSRTVWGLGSFRWERGPIDELFALSIGAKLRLER